MSLQKWPKLLLVVLLPLALSISSPPLRAQVPTAYATVTPAPSAKEDMESMYLPSVTTGPWSPAWSPDGKQLIFAAHGSLWEVPVDGGKAVQITTGPGYDSEPAWAPDGRQIAYTKDTGHTFEIWVANADGTSQHQLTQDSGIDVDPECHSSDTIYYTSSAEGKKFGLWQISASGGTPSKVLVDGVQNIEPSSSPDGNSLVFISAREGFANPGSALPGKMTYGSGDIWKLSLTDGKLALLDREETLWCARPRWSSDGRKIVYVSYRTGSNQLWLLDPASGLPVQLTYLKDSEAFNPSWSPDSQTIAFATNAGHPFAIWTVPAVGGIPKQVHITRLRYRNPMGVLHVRVVDEEKKPTSARVYLEASDGRSWAPDGAFQRVSVVTGDSYFEAPSEFSVELPTGTATVEAVKGFQRFFTKQSVQIREGTPSTIQIQLKRIAGHALDGWVSGDNHVHMNYGGVFRETPTSLISEMDAEDLNVLNDFPTNNQNRLLDMQYFTGHPDSHSTARNILYFNEEYRPSFGGHMDLLNLKQLFFPIYGGYPGTPFASDYPSNAQVLDSVHSQGGIGGFAHPFLIPRGEDPSKVDYAGAREFPADAALGKVDFYDVMCIWTDKFVAEGVWYRLLNLGFRIPISAGSDVMTNYWRAPTVGSVRVYAHTGPTLTYRTYTDAFLKGHAFVSNGPLLSLTVNGKGPGDEINLAGSDSVRVNVKADAWSLVPMEQLDIIENGQVVFTQKATDTGRIQLRTTLEVPSSAWIAARVSGPSAQHLLMDSYVYAHTNPIYVSMAGKPMRSVEDAQYFIQWMNRSIELLDKRTFDNPQQKEQVRDVYEKALAHFEQLAKQ